MSPRLLCAARWYHTYGMHKTTVYLNDEEAEALRKLAAAFTLLPADR